MIAFFKNFSLIFFQDVDLEICIFAGLVKKANSYEAVIGLEVHARMDDFPLSAEKLGNKMIIQELEKRK